ncbi:MAG: hypothetical protein COA36_16755 [Desulfotalea sp.]|nr:MAG: hypothetical protein COA36_16755 [Desulfotalea sp.]
MNFTDKYNNHINNLDKLKADNAKLSKELQGAYDYKEDLITKMQFADKQIKDKQTEYHNMLMKIKSEIASLKIEFDIHVSELNPTI